ncbi:MAG: DUF108 domain-containing protein [Candidatus Omnitrophica bacterium]|nr:DUF108 domain-containing protein [Candidatus Omnitrophota bacterium]
MRSLVRVGLVGAGTIGTYLAKFLTRNFKSQVRLAAIHDAISRPAVRLAASLRPRPKVVDLKTLIRQSDFIIEAAHLSIVKAIVGPALKAGKSVLVMSVGGLFALNLKKLAQNSKGNLYIPSGAIAGVDAFQAARQSGRIHSVTLTTRKPIAGLRGAPLLAQKGIELEHIHGETVLFEGTAEEAVRAFPQNVNVAALLSLATLGPEKVKVRVMTSPEFKKNSHEIRLEAASGSITTRVENEPSRENPKTSALALYSAAALLEKIFSKIKIGT